MTIQQAVPESQEITYATLGGVRINFADILVVGENKWYISGAEIKCSLSQSPVYWTNEGERYAFNKKSNRQSPFHYVRAGRGAWQFNYDGSWEELEGVHAHRAWATCPGSHIRWGHRAPYIAERVTLFEVNLERGMILEVVGKPPAADHCAVGLTLSDSRGEEILPEQYVRCKPFSPEAPIFWVDNIGYSVPISQMRSRDGDKPFADQVIWPGRFQYTEDGIWDRLK